MRLWSLHPSYLDSKGLVALWREGLLAQAVLRGETKGYKNHPQLNRFKKMDKPLGVFANYLFYIAEEADKRGYNFNRKKISSNKIESQIPVMEGQLQYEFNHLLNKLKSRAPDLFHNYSSLQEILPHPLFIITTGGIEDWEMI
ncbi:MAG: DNA lyase [Gammaproteobacteria bacterium]|nr:MAG: DNA lyase [Gammaproteobacteria bacterium]